MKIDGHTRVFALLGHPVAHTLSPAMHNAAFAALGLNAVYVAFDVPPDRLKIAVAGFEAAGFAGLNITVPLKETAFRELPELDDGAQLLGAVNTVKFTERGPIGFNTDGDGFLMAVEEAFGGGVQGLSVFVLGCGGAGRAVALVCARAGARALTLADSEPIRAQRLAGEVRAKFAGTKVTVLVEPREWAPECRKCALAVQATPVGMRADDPSPLPEGAFHGEQCAFDLVYMHPRTAFMDAAAAAGARTANGLGMLLHQGARAFSIWTGNAPAIEPMRQTLEQCVYGT